MSVMTSSVKESPKNLFERIMSDRGTALAWPNSLDIHHMLDSTNSAPNNIWAEDMEQPGRLPNSNELLALKFPFPDSSKLLTEVTDAGDWTTGRLQTISAVVATENTTLAPTNTDSNNVLIDAILPRMPLSVQPIRLQVTFVDPRFQWSDDVEIDRFDALE